MAGQVARSPHILREPLPHRAIDSAIPAEPKSGSEHHVNAKVCLLTFQFLSIPSRTESCVNAN
jgi:hypothetical protein